MIVTSTKQFLHALEQEKTTLRIIDGGLVFVAESGEHVFFHLPKDQEPSADMVYKFAYTHEPINKLYD